MQGLTPKERFTEAQQLLRDHPGHQIFERPLSSWIIQSDRHLPQRFLPLTLRHILQRSFEKLCDTPGVGEKRIEKLLELIGRARNDIQAQPTNGTVPAAPVLAEGLISPDPGLPPIDLDRVSETTWQGWCHTVSRHRLGDCPLGRFARALSTLPRGLWDIPLRRYTEKTLEDVGRLDGHGPSRVRQVLEVIGPLATSIAAVPDVPHLGLLVLPALVHDATAWVEGVLRAKQVPSPPALADCFLRPLLSQLDTDLGRETSAIIRRRLGMGQQPETLEMIGNDIGLTKERVRQLAAKGEEVFRIRWPAGKHLLDDLYELFLSAPAAREQLETLRAVLDGLFSVTIARGGSRAEVLEAWDKAGRQKLTPMTEEEMKTWLAAAFPHIPPETASGWLLEDGLRTEAEDGRTLYFSHDPLDQLLHRLHHSGEPLPMAEVLEFIEGEERNVRTRLERDPRFLEDEFKCVLASERCSFSRTGGAWYVKLQGIPGRPSLQRSTALPIDSLAHLILGGLTKAGISDATVWGVHRYANEVLAAVYGAKLPESVTPFILASTLTRHSDGLIRHMRRRRLRWDPADGSLPVHGKCGWVGQVVCQANVPMTLEELDAGLRRHYQDYEWYVLSQLNLDEDEEGEHYCGAKVVPGISHTVPSIVLPYNWELDLARENVSEGVKLFVARVVSASTKGGFPKQYLRRLPWVVQLAEHLAYGGMRWVEASGETADEPPSDEQTQTAGGAAQSPAAEPATGGGQEIEDLLSRFF